MTLILIRKQYFWPSIDHCRTANGPRTHTEQLLAERKSAIISCMQWSVLSVLPTIRDRSTSTRKHIKQSFHPTERTQRILNATDVT